jgi:thiosulfate reductase cytochrome b subunit
MERAHQTHTLRTRTGHWINVAIVALLVWTGFSMFAGDRQFAAFVRMLPAAFWQTLHAPGNKHQLLSWHIYAGILFGLNGLAYVISLIVTGAWRRIAPKGNQWVHDPRRPLAYSVPQRVAYTAVIAGASVMVLTGVALGFKHQIPWLLGALGGERLVMPVHVVLATSLLAFVAVHALQVVRAGMPTFRSMTVGPAMSKEPAAVRLPVENPL